MLEIIRESKGCAVAVDDAELIADARLLSSLTGVCACPEGGATLSALKRLLASGQVKRDERVVLFNTGTGAKYAEAFAS
jgi:threonine synthase